MDIRRSINTRVWSDDWFEGLNSSEKLLWIYFLTNAQTNMLGIYEISLKRIQFETGLNKDTIEKALKGFEKVKKAFYKNGFIILPNWLKNQAMNPNMLKSAETLYGKLPNHLINSLISNGFESFESLSNGCLILPKKEKEIEGEIETEIEVENEIILPFDSEDFLNKWNTWKEFRKKEHSFNYKSSISEQAALNKLAKLSDHNELKAIEIIEQSIANGWQGLFEIKDEKDIKPKVLGFNPFDYVAQ